MSSEENIGQRVLRELEGMNKKFPIPWRELRIPGGEHLGSGKQMGEGQFRVRLRAPQLPRALGVTWRERKGQEKLVFNSRIWDSGTRYRSDQVSCFYCIRMI